MAARCKCCSFPKLLKVDDTDRLRCPKTDKLATDEFIAGEL